MQHILIGWDEEVAIFYCLWLKTRRTDKIVCHITNQWFVSWIHNNIILQQAIIDGITTYLKHLSHQL